MSDVEEADYEVEEDELAESTSDQAPTTLFRTDEPTEVVSQATEVADSLSEVVRQQDLTANIQGKEHVLVEGWTLLGSMMGVFPVTKWTKQIKKNGQINGYEARVEAQTKTGQVIGAAEAMCTRDERNWSDRDDFALRSMAQTRATSKALRMPLGFVMNLAGFESTPAEEMDGVKRSRGNSKPSKGSQKQMADNKGSITDKQRKAIHGKAKGKICPDKELDGKSEIITYIKSSSGVESLNDLSKSKASKVIDWLETLPEEGEHVS